MSEHVEYPLTMAHPGYTPSKSLPIPGTERKGPTGNVISQDYQGTPERYPPVTVQSADEQEYYESQGYKPAGHSDPAAYATAMLDAPPADYEPVEYPKWVDGVLIEGPDQEVVGSGTNIAQARAQPSADFMTEMSMKAQEIEDLKRQLAAATAPKNKGGRPRKAPAEQHAA